MSSFKQVNRSSWPSGYGDVLAVLDTSIEELASRYSLELFEDSDNLGTYDAAAIELDSGRRLGLLHHHGSPPRGVEIHGDSEDDAEEALQDLLTALALSWDSCLWVRDTPHYHGTHNRSRLNFRY
jgi:hypothetical protein